MMKSVPSSVSPQSRAHDLLFTAVNTTELETYLASFLNTKAAAAGQIDTRYQDLLARMVELISRGGKRLRPRLVMATYQAYGGQDQQAVTKAAASQELFHAFILMHDDIIDRDLKRWGGPNISGYYNQALSDQLLPDEARHFADAWALLAGDICLGLSMEMLLDSGFSAARLMQSLKLVQQTLFTVVGGELTDIALPIYEPAAGLVEAEALLRLYENKTACYSFSTPLRLGALLAGVGSEADRKLLAFGQEIGVAFQLKDDILDIFGDERLTGKSTLSDLQQGKRTMLINTGLRLANASQRRRLERLIGNPEASHEDLATVRTILSSCGALAATEAAVHTHCQSAHSILLQAKFPLQLSAYLADLLSFCAEREY